jgi:tetratricopeptide (TPR) repeat protein
MPSGRTFKSAPGPRRFAWLVRFLCVAACALALWPADGRAQEKIPPLESVPETLSPSLKASFSGQRQALQQQLGVLQAAAAAFNAKKAEDQTDAEYDAVQAQRTRYIEAAKAFNQTLQAEKSRQAAAGALPNTDPMVVDGRNVPSGLPKSVDNAIPHTPAGERVRKGFEALQIGDWKVALTWFQDALGKDPGDPDLQRLVDLAQFTLVYRTQVTARANGTGSGSSQTAQLPGQTSAPDSSSEKATAPNETSLAIISANSAAAHARAEVAFEQYVEKYGTGHVLEREAAVWRAERGEGFTKEQLKEQLQQALKDYHRRHDNEPDATMGASPTADEVILGGKG